MKYNSKKFSGCQPVSIKINDFYFPGYTSDTPNSALACWPPGKRLWASRRTRKLPTHPSWGWTCGSTRTSFLSESSLSRTACLLWAVSSPPWWPWTRKITHTSLSSWWANYSSVLCCCKLNNIRFCDEHLFGQVSTHTQVFINCQYFIAQMCAPAKIRLPII